MHVQQSLLSSRISQILAIGLLVPMIQGVAYSQTQLNDAQEDSLQSTDEEQREKDGTTEVIEVKGVRQVVRSSISTKRYSNAIVDAITAEDIGDLPAQSLSEVMETITGAGGHRGKGGGSEIALRGLGPFLGNTTFNGGQASNGSGDRSVNFSQFPSEVINQVSVYKTQQANLIEGGISGTIDIGTVKPLDYGKRLIRGEVKGSYNPYADKMEFGDSVGSRLTLSYIDQYSSENLGEIGLSIGIQRNDTTNPQDRVYSSSTWSACDQTVMPAALGDPNDSDGKRGRFARCTNTSLTPGSENSDNPYYLVPNSFGIRQQGEKDQRDAAFLGLQWKPSDRLTISMDSQLSLREYIEDRHDLAFSDARRIGPDRKVAENGALTYFEGTSQLSAEGDYFIRNEDYKGGRFNIAYNATNYLTLKFDLSYSDTVRNDLRRRTRLRSDTSDIYGNELPQNEDFPSTWGGKVYYTWDFSKGTDVPIINVDPRFDVTNHDLFSDDLRLLRDETESNYTVSAAAFDASYLVGDSPISSIDAGIRFARLSYDDFFTRVEYTQSDREIDRQANESCRTAFPQQDFLSDASGAAITEFATFDSLCLFNAYVGDDDLVVPDDALLDPANVNLTEETFAGYAMASYNTLVADKELRGNFGVRVVKTKVESTGLRTALVMQPIGDSGGFNLVPDGESYENVVFENDFVDVLPSVNLVYSLADDVLLRGAIYRALARPDPSALGAGRNFSTNSDENGFTNIEDAIAGVTAEGSPYIEPLRAWNYDISLEWYPNEDSLLSFATYYKEFEGGTIPEIRNEVFEIEGQQATVPVQQDKSTEDTSSLLGFELSLAHTFTWLPDPFKGLGVKAGYNYADTNYKTQDILLGDQYDPETSTVIKGIIEPAGLSGSAKHTLSAQLFYAIGDFDIQAIYNYRSEYFQAFLGGNSQLRYVPDVNTVNLRASYTYSKSLKFQFDAVNITDEPRVDYMPVMGSFRDYQAFGTTYYLSARYTYR
ncbi:TonB-dependent receptor [Bowmanella dokdonensis]|uniref:TonB-dependent receptor n=1 Tax=Bowmanella dokdonensis TaxID=751969 RepID=A0A939DSJ1_9ALTE|nr:TonB-dependent receptor [Bowmanella dokdonensis]MBN7827151.1 TonB-dependent receptor [Bowmanella dokdonensis]